MKLDFSSFHPLDHWPGTKYCRSFPGGTWFHLKLTWDFRRRNQVLYPWYRFLRCPFNKHQWWVWYGTDGQINPMCNFCYKTRLPSEYEIDQTERLPFWNSDRDE